MGYLFTHVTNDVFWSPHLKQGHKTRYLFLGDHNPAANKGTPRIKQHLKIEGADKVVLADFMTLQSVWRREDTLRSTFKRMPSSQEERQVWKHLIEYLTSLPPPKD
jgi:hypothetical protein